MLDGEKYGTNKFINKILQIYVSFCKACMKLYCIKANSCEMVGDREEFRVVFISKKLEIKFI